MISKIYKSEDTDAPLLTHVKGSLISLLKKVLIEGYGNKDPLGWTLAFEDTATNVAVFRMGAGSKAYMRVDDNLTTGYATIQCYETMSSVNDGMSACPPLTETGYKYIYYSNTSYAGNKTWVIIGDDAGFYIMNNIYATVPYNTKTGYLLSFNLIAYIGDYVPFDLTRKHLLCTFLEPINAYNYFFGSNSITVSTSKYLVRDLNKELGAVQIGLGQGTSYTYGSNYAFGNNCDLSPVNGSYLYVNTTIHTATTVIGKLPGLFNPLSKVLTVTDSDLIAFMDTDGERTGFVFTTGVEIYMPNSGPTYVQRFMITIGDRFRYAQ